MQGVERADSCLIVHPGSRFDLRAGFNEMSGQGKNLEGKAPTLRVRILLSLQKKRFRREEINVALFGKLDQSQDRFGF